MKRLKEKKEKKSEIVRMMKELEDMISLIGSDAVQNNMAIYNENDNDDNEDAEEFFIKQQQKALQS